MKRGENNGDLMSLHQEIAFSCESYEIHFGNSPSLSLSLGS